jgi:hypothetical protein
MAPSVIQEIRFMPRRIGSEEPTPTNLNDRRVFPRLRKNGTVLLHMAGNPRRKSINAIIENVSHGGISVTTEPMLKIGEQVVVEIHVPGEAARRLLLKAKVRWIASNNSTGLDCVGCKWLQPLGLDDLIHLV